MSHKKIVILSLILPVLFLAACTERQNPVVDKPRIKPDIPEQQTEEENYTISSSTIPGWSTLTSHTCGFEISYPSEMKVLSHCEEKEIKYYNSSYLNMLSLSYIKGESAYGDDGDISLSFAKSSNIPSSKKESCPKTRKEGYSEKSGKTVSYYEEIYLLENLECILNTEYFGPIEGPDRLKKSVSINYNDLNYSISSDIPYNNKERNLNFKEILKSLKFIGQ